MKQAQNTIWSITQHIATIICGLILPREILAHYGSEMNGIVQKAKSTIMYAAIGLVITLLAAAIVNLVVSAVNGG